VKPNARDLIRAFVRVGDTCSEDERFLETTKYWTGGLRLGIGDICVVFQFDSGKLVSVSETCEEVDEVSDQFGFDASPEAWGKLLSSTDEADGPVVSAWADDIARTGDRDAYWRYYLAFRRLLELTKEELE
jgi:hypothetical protein